MPARPAKRGRRAGERTGSWILPIALALQACASAPPAPAPGTGQVWGTLSLVPREGVVVASPGAASYGDRRMRDVSLVDYSQPGFAVVYVEEGDAPADSVELSIRSSLTGPSLEPRLAALGERGRLLLRNDSKAAHVVSCPGAGLVRSLAPGESVALDRPSAGEHGVFLLDAPHVRATVFVAPGPYAEVGSTGRYVLSDLAPGAATLRVWHPRFPPARHALDLAADTSLHLDLEIGVDRGEEAPHAH